MISAKIVADSRNSFGDRITTFLLVMPRIVLAEFNTHRMISRNSASSRAIPFKKMVEQVETNPFIPLAFQKNHSGMQGSEYHEGTAYETCKQHWIDASKSAAAFARHFNDDLNVTKQLANRMLEPYMYHTVLATATEWENFFALRAHPAAEIHIQHLAHLMLEEYNNSTPKNLVAGQWHIPFGDQIDNEELKAMAIGMDKNPDLAEKILNVIQMIEDEGNKAFGGGIDGLELLKVPIATARCAQVSYTVIGEEGKPMNYEKLYQLHNRLKTAGHWSPFEHCAKAMTEGEYDSSFHKGHSGEGPDFYTNGWSGNFRGFVQYRKTFFNENQKDPRVIQK